MNIGIDVKCLSKRYTGIAVYVNEMLKFFNEMADSDDIFYLFSNKNFELDFKLKSNFHKVIFKSVTGSTGIMFHIGKYIEHYSIDVFWGTEHVLPIINVNSRLVVTIHDLAVLNNPKLGTRYNAFLQRQFTIRCCKKADTVIAISKATARDVAKLAEISEDKIKIVYNGDSPYNGKPKTFTNREAYQIREKYRLSHPFFLYMGTIEPRKNIVTIVKAYNRFRERNSQHIQLVLAGGLGWRYSATLEEIKRSNYKNDILLTGYCSETEREFLYRNAISLVFPSLYEGFGFPILEAMSVGIPVITSNVSAMPEVGGRFAYYLQNITDADELCVLMERVYNLTDDQRKLLDFESRKWAGTFSRRDCALKIYDILRNKQK